MVKLTQKLSTKTFVISQILILVVSLIFLGGLHYFLNMQNNNLKKYASRGPVTSTPVLLDLKVANPDDNLLTFNSPYQISGQTAPKAYVLISSQEKDQLVQAESDGAFAVSFPLTEGVNELTITSFDQKGEQRSLTRSVYYSREKL